MSGNEILARNIKWIRKEILKETQEEFAFNCGFCKETLSLIEREKGNPKMDIIQKIADYSGFTMAELFTERT